MALVGGAVKSLFCQWKPKECRDTVTFIEYWYLMHSRFIGLSRLLAPAPLRKLIDAWPRYRHPGSFELRGWAVNGDLSHRSLRMCIIRPNHKSLYWRVESAPNYQKEEEGEGESVLDKSKFHDIVWEAKRDNNHSELETDDMTQVQKSAGGRGKVIRPGNSRTESH